MTIASTTSADPGGGASDASGAAGALVFGEDVAGLEDPEIWCWGPPRQALGQDHDRDEQPDPRAGQFVVQGEEVPGLCRSAAGGAPVS